jgi:hypothetical protein
MKVALFFALFALAGCGAADRFGASLTGHAKVCIDGVEYLQFASGATVAYTRDGKVKTCGAP